MLNMKNKLAKRIMAFVLSGAMIVSGLAPSGVTAYAAETSTEITEEFVEETDENDAETVSGDAEEETPDEDSGADAEEETVAEDVNEETSKEAATKEDASTSEAEEEAAESTVTKNPEKEDAEETAKEEENKATGFSLSADEIEVSELAETTDTNGNIIYELSSEYTNNGFTIRASSNKKVTVDAGKKTITDGDKSVTINRRIKMGGGLDANTKARSIKFNPDGKGKLKVYAISSGKDERQCILYKENDAAWENKTETAPASSDGVAVLTYDIPEAGEYYIAGASAINFYYFEFVPEEESSTETTTPPSESESDSGFDPESTPPSESESDSGSDPESEPEPDIPEDQKHTVWIVGDSTVSAFNDAYYYPRYGYGTQLQNYLDGYYTVKNIAASGRSSKSYITDKESGSLYTDMVANIKSGDVLIIGFGHNDSKNEQERYTNPNGGVEDAGSFANSLYYNYVKKAEDVGAKAIICTPIVRRNGDKDTLSDKDCHITADQTDNDGNTYPGGDYPEAIRKLGQEKSIPVVDLTALTKNLYEEVKAAKTLYMHAWTSSKEGSVDDTHLNIYGAKKIAYILATEISRTDLDIAQHTKNLETEPTQEKDLKPNPDYKEVPYNPPTTKSALCDDYGIFKGTAFGDLGGNPSKSNHILEKDTDGNMHMAVANNKGKITDGGDGLIMYYYQIPANSTFTLSADAKINGIDANNQVAFGLMARDDMYIDKYEKLILSDYVAAGTFGTKSTNCFRRQSSKLTRGESLAADVKAGESYKLSITKSTDGYTCTFGDNSPQSGGYDYKLTTIDSDYQYIGMFVARNADITFSNIKLTVDGEEIEIMNTTPEPTPPDPGPGGDNDLTMEGDGGEVSVADGLLKGKKYGYKDVATFEVLNDMPFKTEAAPGGDSYAITVDGKDYAGCVQGSGNGKDKNEIPADGTAAFKITAIKDSKITFIVRQNNRNYWFTDGADTGETLQNIPADKQTEGGASRTFYMKSGHIYYFYAGGSKVMVAAISIAKSGADDEGWPFDTTTNPSEPGGEGSSVTTSGEEGSGTPGSGEEGSGTPDSGEESSGTSGSSEEGSGTPGSSEESSSTPGSSEESSSTPGSSEESSSTPSSSDEYPETPETKIPANSKVKTISLNDKTLITIEAADIVYSNKQQYAITVTYTAGDKQQQLTENLHYTVDPGSENLSSEGVKTVTIKGTGKKTDLGIFINEEKAAYEVVLKAAKTDISKEKGIFLNKSDAKQSYTGSYITPEPSISIPEKNADGKANYKVVYKDNVNAGKASIVVIGQGDYYGTKVLPFTINKTDLSKTTLAITSSNAEITGSAKAYKATDKTTKGSFEYKGVPVTLNGLTLKIQGSDRALSAREDYTLAYKKNAQAGKATLTIKGANNLSGAIKIEYTIEPKDIKAELANYAPDKATTLESALPAEYSSKGARLTEIKLANGIILKENTDYKVKYGKDCKTVTAGQEQLLTVTISGAGSYKDVIGKNTPVAVKVVKGKYHIKDNTIVDMKKSTSADKFINAAKITDASGAKVKPADITLEGYEAGKALTTIKVIPNNADSYETTQLSCRVAEMLGGVKLSTNIPDQPFDGVNSVTLTEKRIERYTGLEAGDIRIVSYKNNNKLGSATVTIEGRASGKYYGTRNLKFKIALTGSDRNPEDEEDESTPGSSGGSTGENPSEPSSSEESSSAESSSSEESSSAESSSGEESSSAESSSGEESSSAEQSSEEGSETEPSTGIQPDPPVNPSGKKIDVWDFGTKQETETDKYNNNIIASDWNGILVPDSNDASKILFNENSGTHTFGDLSINYAKGDRIYADPAVTGITASDGKEITFTTLNNNYKKDYGDGYTAAGGWYGNGSRTSANGYVLIQNVRAGDKVIAYAGNHNKTGEVTFSFALEGNEAAPLKSTEALGNAVFTKAVFIAEEDGTYKIYQSAGAGKPMYNRIVRVPAVEISGSIDKGPLDSLDGATIKFVNTETGAETTTTPDSTGKFKVALAAGYTYIAALVDKTGYGFTNDTKTVTLTDDEALTGKDSVSLTVEARETYQYKGSVTGFGEGYDLSNLIVKLMTENDSVKLVDYKSNQTLDFDVMLEPDVEYTIVLEGVNDYKVTSAATVNRNEKDENAKIEVGLKDVQTAAGSFIDLDRNALTGITGTLVFTNADDKYTYDTTIENNRYSIQLRDGAYSVEAKINGYRTSTHIVVEGEAVDKDLLLVSTAEEATPAFASDLYVGYPDKANHYETVTKAVKAAKLMRKNTGKEKERITIHLAPGIYQEQVIVDVPYITLKNEEPSKEAKITWYYGIGYAYYSVDDRGYYSEERAYDQYEKKHAARWGCSVRVTATDFRAENITFENSFNRYITQKEIDDGVLLHPEGTNDSKASFVRKLTSTNEELASKKATERAAAVALDSDKAEFYNCKFLSSQDTLYTTGRAYYKNCFIEGNTDYIFGDGDQVFDTCELSWGGYTDEAAAGYITANKDTATYGYLFRNCTITANKENKVTAGYLGRPWGAQAKAVFVNTKQETADIINTKGWGDMNGATAAANPNYKEYNTTALDGKTIMMESPRTEKYLTENPVSDIKTYFGGDWTPGYYTEESEGTTVSFTSNPVITDD